MTFARLLVDTFGMSVFIEELEKTSSLLLLNTHTSGILCVFSSQSYALIIQSFKNSPKNSK